MSSRTDRREFLQHTARAATAALISSSAAGRLHAADGELLPIVDTHQHLWDLERLRLPWLAGVPDLKRSYLPADYRRAAEGQNVVASVYMEVDVDPALLDVEAQWIIGLCKSGEAPLRGAVIGGRPAAENFRAYINRYRDEPLVKGVRQVLHNPATQPGYCLQKGFLAGVRYLGQLGKSFDLCIRPTELGDAARLARQCPDTRLVLDHCGNISTKTKDLSRWKRDIERVAGCENVVCKVSGQIDKAPPGWTAQTLAPVVNHVLEVFGPQRVITGGDWPVCNLGGTLSGWFSALRSILAERPLEVQRAVLHDNARRVYQLA